MIFALIVAAALGVPSPGDMVTDLDKPSIQATKMFTRFGECVARSRGKDVDVLLSTNYASAAELDALLRAARTDSDCDLSGAGGMKISQPLLTGAILEAYYHRKLEGGGQQLMPQTSGWTGISAQPGESAAVQRNAALTNLGACLSYRNPTAVAALLNTKSMTYGERDATAALRATLQECAMLTGETSLAQQELRAVAATGLTNRLLKRSHSHSSDVH